MAWGRMNSWRNDSAVRKQMFAVFPLMRRLHELLWYLDVAAALPIATTLRREIVTQFDRVESLTLGSAEELLDVDVDSHYAAARPLLLRASAAAREARRSPEVASWAKAGVDRVGVNLADSDLRGAELRGALLIAADLSGSDLRWCDLLGADLRDANLAEADLSEAIYLTQVQVNSAKGNAGTRLPEGFDRPQHWRFDEFRDR